MKRNNWIFFKRLNERNKIDSQFNLEDFELNGLLKWLDVIFLSYLIQCYLTKLPQQQKQYYEMNWYK